MATSRWMSKLYGSSWYRQGRGLGSWVALGTTKGFRASIVTTHGEMLVPRFFPRKGPNGTYSHFWMSRAVMKEGEEFIDLQHLISTELWHESMKFTGMTDNESFKGANLCTYHSSHSSEPCQRCDPLPCPCLLALPAGCRGRLGMPSPAQSQIICKDQTLVAELQQIRKNTIMKTLLHVCYDSQMCISLWYMYISEFLSVL